jgi:hypothetical protein
MTDDERFTQSKRILLSLMTTKLQWQMLKDTRSNGMLLSLVDIACTRGLHRKQSNFTNETLLE